MSADLVLADTPHGLQVTYRDRRLYGPRPLEDAARRARAATLPPDTLVLWTSPVAWHGWAELAGRLDARSAVLAVEADPVLRELSSRFLPNAPTRLALTSDASDDAVRALRAFGQHRFRRVMEFSTASSALAHRDAYRSLRDVLDREIRVFWQNRLTLSAMGRLWLRNLIRNVSALPNALPLSPIGAPTIVCGAGPSLEAAIPLLTRHRAGLRIVAVDTALPILDAHGILPDIVVGLEGQLANVYDFLPVRDRRYRLVSDLSAHPAPAELHPRTSWTLTEFAPFTLLHRAAALPGLAMRIPPLGSVGVAAVHVASALEASPILLTGLDFAVQAGSTHARGAPSYLWEYIHCDRLRPFHDPTMGARLLQIPGVVGRARTTLVLQGYAADLATIVRARDDVYAVSALGLDVGARRLTTDQADALLGGTLADRGFPRPRAVQSAPPTTGSPNTIRSRSLVTAFVRRELAFLDAFERQIDALATLPPEVDYLACELHDRITRNSDRMELLPFDRQSRARARVAVSYYRHRWQTALATVERSAAL